MIRGNLIGNKNYPTSTKAAGVWSLQEQFLATKAAIWPGEAVQLTGIVYSQSSVYSSNSAANYTGMNNNSANGSILNQTGTNTENGAFVKADCGTTKFIKHIIIGYDYLNNLPGGWGVSYAENVPIQGSLDNVTWTALGNTPTYSSTGSTNGLVTVNINQSFRYIRLTKNGYLALLEFQVWGF